MNDNEQEYKGYIIRIEMDDNPLDPREWDNLGHMICFNRQYDLGDKHDMDIDELKELVKREDVLALPLYVLDHSGLWMRTGRFAEDYGGWDTSMVGYIYVTYEELRKEYSAKNITKAVLDKATRVLESEVSTYSDYISGDVCGFIVEDTEGELVDSCWGYYGRQGVKDAIDEAKSIIDSLHERWVEKLIDAKVIEIKEEEVKV